MILAALIFTPESWSRILAAITLRMCSSTNAYRSVRIKVPLHLDEYHEWGMRIDDPKLVKRLERLFPRRAPVRTTSSGTPTLVVAAQAEASASEALEASKSEVAWA